jgi:hypothetical protein
MPGRLLIRLSVVAACCIGATALIDAQSGQRERARFWTIPPDDYHETGDAVFPETPLLPADRDIGLAFSGGGVRSAAETTGELRGLEQIGLLSRVRYTSAVSGGSWALIPWTFSGAPDLLGRYRNPEDLRFEDVTTVDNGSLAGAIKGVSLFADVLKEVGLIAGESNVADDSLVSAVRTALGGADKSERTYASLLMNNLIGRLIPNAADSDFGLNSAEDDEFHAQNPTLARRRTLYPQPGRPFMIVNANILNAGSDIPHPGVIPIEMTPLYVGTRQQLGGLLGGMYVWPTAYNAATAVRAKDNRDFIEYTHSESHGRLSLADLAAASGAAPLYFIAGGNTLPPSLRDAVRAKGTSYFPSFTHLAIRNGEVVKPTVAWPHADGGARDNLGVTALLARHLKKIVVFVNVDNADFANNDDIRSLFLHGAVSATDDKRDNVVFKGGERAYSQLIADMTAARNRRAPVVACGTFNVMESRAFNIRAYDGVSICWVYPYRVETWMDALDKDVRALVEGRDSEKVYGNFQGFPWFKTFFQDHTIQDYIKLNVLKLQTPQVNLLSDLTAWTVVRSKPAIEAALGASR